MKTLLKILVFFILFVVASSVLFSLLGFITKVVVLVGLLAILGGLLYLFFGPSEPAEAQPPERIASRKQEKLAASAAREVQAELNRRKKETR